MDILQRCFSVMYKMHIPFSDSWNLAAETSNLVLFDLNKPFLKNRAALLPIVFDATLQEQKVRSASPWSAIWA